MAIATPRQQTVRDFTGVRAVLGDVTGLSHSWGHKVRATLEARRLRGLCGEDVGVEGGGLILEMSERDMREFCEGVLAKLDEPEGIDRPRVTYDPM
jgi:hypothetical protein